jgi:hypothetical protein
MNHMFGPGGGRSKRKTTKDADGPQGILDNQPIHKNVISRKHDWLSCEIS